jgi:hypothetical protein
LFFGVPKRACLGKLTKTYGLPTALGHARDLTIKGKLPKTQTTQLKLPDVAAWATAQPATITQSHPKLGRLHIFNLLRYPGHLVSNSP